MNRKTFWLWYRTSEFGKGAGYKPREFAEKVFYTGNISDNENKLCRPDPVTLDLELVRLPIIHAWGYIGADVERNAQWSVEHGDPKAKLTNLMAIEIILDQDHLTASDESARHVQDGKCIKLVGSEKTEIAKSVIAVAEAKFGYEAVLRYLAKHIQLV